MSGTAMRRSLRVVAGFLIAPLVPGALELLYVVMAPVVRGESLESQFVYLGEPLVAGMIGFVTVACYATELTIGLPAFLSRRRRGIGFLGTTIFGLAIGGLAIPAIYVGWCLASGVELEDAINQIVFLDLWIVGPIAGLIVAISFWLIVRPDRLDATRPADPAR